MTDAYEILREAEERQRQADNRVREARRKVEQIEQAFRKALYIGRNEPCAAAVLPSGKIAVHVWVESVSDPNQLHVLTPAYLDEHGEPRSKYPYEQLGSGRANCRE